MRLQPYGPHKTLCNRFVRSSQAGVFDHIFAEPAAGSTATGRVMIDATHPLPGGLSHSNQGEGQGTPHGGEFAQKGAAPRRIGRTKGGLDSKLRAVCDGDGKPLILRLTEGQVSDCEGARHTFGDLPGDAKTYIGDRGYDADWLREALQACGVTPSIPPRRNRVAPIAYETKLSKSGNLVERMFGRLKDWRRISLRDDRCAHTLMSAIRIAATGIFWV